MHYINLLLTLTLT